MQYHARHRDVAAEPSIAIAQLVGGIELRMDALLLCHLVERQQLQLLLFRA